MLSSSFALPRAAKLQSKSSGFSLLEIMVVVAIISIIASIVAPNYQYARSVAQVNSVKVTLKEVASAMDLYFSDYRAYPGNGNWHDVTTLLPSYYLPAVPCDPLDVCTSTHSSFQVAISDDGQSYMIYDSVQYHSKVLSNLYYSYGWSGPNGTSCGASYCTRIMYGSSYGLAGFP